MSKPNTKTAMQQLIAQIQQTIPLNLDEAQMCQGECLGCSKKMLEMLDAEIRYWQYSDAVPSLKDLKTSKTLAVAPIKFLNETS